jgi:hypothetical protein
MPLSLSQQFRDADPESLGEDFESAQGNIALLAFHRSDVRSMKFAEIGQLLLRVTMLFAKRTHVTGKDGAE